MVGYGKFSVFESKTAFHQIPYQIEAAVGCLTQALLTSAQKQVPHSRPGPRKHRTQWTPAIAKAATESKEAMKLWKDAGSPLAPHPLWHARTTAKKALRAALRTQVQQNRQRLFTDILEASTSNQKLFHQIIRRQRGTNSQQHGLTLRVDGDLVTEESEVRDAWRTHFLHLGTPADDPRFNEEHLRLAESAVDLIQQICTASDVLPTPISEKEVLRAIKKLNNGKAADESGLAAEHLKLGGRPHISHRASSLVLSYQFSRTRCRRIHTVASH